LDLVIANELATRYFQVHIFQTPAKHVQLELGSGGNSANHYDRCIERKIVDYVDKASQRGNHRSK